MSGAVLDLSVVVPCFDSGDELGELADRLDGVLDRMGGRSEILFVNDGYQAATWKRIDALAARIPRLWGIALDAQVGQHRATLAGIDQSLGEIVVTLDDDLEHRPEDIPQLVDALRSRPDVDCVLAAFPEEHRPLLRRAASAVMDRLYRLRWGGPPALEMTPFRALRRSLARQMVASAGADSFIPRLLLQCSAGMLNVPVTHAPSRRPSHYSTAALARIAWKGLAGGASRGRSLSEAPMYRVRAKTGRRASDPRGAVPWAQ